MGCPPILPCTSQPHPLGPVWQGTGSWGRGWAAGLQSVTGHSYELRQGCLGEAGAALCLLQGSLDIKSSVRLLLGQGSVY